MEAVEDSEQRTLGEGGWSRSRIAVCATAMASESFLRDTSLFAGPIVFATDPARLLWRVFACGYAEERFEAAGGGRLS